MTKLNSEKEKIKTLYVEKLLTAKEISIIFHVSEKPIFRILRQNDVEIRGNEVIRDIKKHIIDKVFIDENKCWNYIPCGSKQGYARIKEKLAHRVSYEIFKGKIPKGLSIDHKCRNIKCINPEHLEAVTQRENTLRGISIVAKNAKKTHCLRGHELSGENLTIQNNTRQCKKCNFIRTKTFRDKNRRKT